MGGEGVEASRSSCAAVWEGDWSCNGQSSIDKQQSLGRALIDSCYFGEAMARLPITLITETLTLNDPRHGKPIGNLDPNKIEARPRERAGRDERKSGAVFIFSQISVR